MSRHGPWFAAGLEALEGAGKALGGAVRGFQDAADRPDAREQSRGRDRSLWSISGPESVHNRSRRKWTARTGQQRETGVCRAGEGDQLDALRQAGGRGALARRREHDVQAERHEGEQPPDDLFNLFQPAICLGTARARHLFGPQMQIVARDQIGQRALGSFEADNEERPVNTHGR